MDIKLKSEEIDVFQKNEIASNRTVSIALINAVVDSLYTYHVSILIAIPIMGRCGSFCG